MTKAFTALGFLSLFFLLMGIGTSLYYHKYHPASFAAGYATLLGLPFIWVLPNPNLSSFRTSNGILIGLGAVTVMGIIHLLHYFAGGNSDSFLILFPLVAFVEVVLVGSFFLRK